MPRTLLDEQNVASRYKTLEHTRRRAVLQDTVTKFSQAGAAEAYAQQAQKNHQEWQSAPKELPKRVRVLAGDWGDITQSLSKASGNIYAVLNMANAYGPGGGYLEGMIAQEENMYRRTDCHFYVHDDEMDQEKRLYTPKITDLINGVSGKVYLDTQNPRVCIKGSERTQATGYDDLLPNDYFLFYELKSAADDLRGGHSFNEASMRKKISAQLNTLKEKNIRHVVLSAFGCGAFANPATQVARIYREELEKHVDDFDDVVFAVFHAGYGPNNFTPFKETLEGLPLNTKTLESNRTWLAKLRENVNQKVWDERGFVFLFFDFRKTPTGIVQMRAILNSELNHFDKIIQLKQIAQERLDNPPRFTDRNNTVKDLYEEIVTLDLCKVDEELMTQSDAQSLALNII